MKKINWVGVGLVACLLMSTMAWAAEKAEQPVLFKSGDISFTILKSDGETPVDGAKIKLSRSVKSKTLSEAVANKDGQAVISLAAGKYFLKVEGRNITEMNVADEAAITECRVVLDDDKAGLVLVGGAGAAAAGAAVAGTGAAAAGAAAAIGAGTFTTIVVGGAAVMVAAGGGYAVYDHNKDDDDPVPEPTPTPTPTPTPRARPSNR